jgi:hypothetical protein
MQEVQQMRNPSKYLLAAAVVTSILVAAPLALGAGEGRPLDGGARNPSDDARQNYTRETEIIADVPTYATRQSNKSATGGGATYGCRATATASRACVRASNLADGLAFSFAGKGATVGRIEATTATARPFTTNATGVATGLNADQVDGKSASDIAADARANNLFASVSAAGALGGGRGASAASPEGTGVYLVTFNRDVTACAYNATVIGGAGAVGFASVEPVGAQSLRVRTFDVAGPAAADRAFHLTAIC